MGIVRYRDLGDLHHRSWTTFMFLIVSRLFLLLLLFADWAGDPYCGRSPLSRPFSSQDAFCHSAVDRDNLVRVITLSRTDSPILPVPSSTLAMLDAPLTMQRREAKHRVLPATHPRYALMS